MMQAFLKISWYIYLNNPWYLLPWRMVQAFIYQCQKRLTKRIIVKNLFNGKKIFLFPSNPISSCFIYTSIPDKEEIVALRALSDDNTIFLDIGANVGSYSLLLLDKVKTVYAFEAHPLTANYCKMNFLLNNISETQVLAMAVSNRSEALFFSNEMGACPTNHLVQSQDDAIMVPAITLDQFIESKALHHCSFILKIDVEGYEYEVLQGALRFLHHFTVKGIIFEKFSSKNSQIVNMLQQLGFEVNHLNENNMLAIRHAR